MILTIILGLCLGVLAGTFTGLFPGIHINLVSAGLLAAVGGNYFLGVAPLVLTAFVVAMAITHTFIDFIPSIFLGAPEEDSFLAVLPGHQLLREGKGHEAVVMTLYGGLAALPIIAIFSVLFIYFLPDVYLIVQKVMPYILIFISLYLIFSEREWVIAGTVFLAAGFLGMFSFYLPIKEPLLPLLSGLFGVSGLVVSIASKISVPEQKIRKLRNIGMPMKELVRWSVAGAIVAPLCSFMPGMGSGHAAVIGSEIGGRGKEEQKGFLYLVGMINTIVMALSFVTIYAIGRTRSGAAVAVSELLGEISLRNIEAIMGVIFISGIIAFFAGLYLSGFFCRHINRIRYDKLSIGVVGLLLLVNLVLTNWIGIIVLVTASALGVFCIQSGVRRIQLMGVLLIPTIVYYLF